MRPHSKIYATFSDASGLTHSPLRILFCATLKMRRMFFDQSPGLKRPIAWFYGFGALWFYSSGVGPGLSKDRIQNIILAN